MIHHLIRFNTKPGVTDEQIEELLDSLREQRAVPGVVLAFAGRIHGDDRTWGANFVLEGLDSYWRFITDPAHLKTDRLGWPLLEDFQMFDLTDNDDPELGAAIAALHERRLRDYPELRSVVGDTAASGDPRA